MILNHVAFWPPSLGCGELKLIKDATHKQGSTVQECCEVRALDSHRLKRDSAGLCCMGHESEFYRLMFVVFDGVLFFKCFLPMLLVSNLMISAAFSLGCSA